MVDDRGDSGEIRGGRDTIPGPGARLRRAREAKGFSQRDLADRLHLNQSIVEHLEEDRFDDLPEPAYVRGYLRACARALELDPEPLIEAYDAQGMREPRLDTPPVVNRAATSAARSGHRKAPYVLGAVILLAVGVLIVYGWYERQADDAMPTAVEAERLPIERPAPDALEPEPPPPPPLTMTPEPPEPRAEPLPEVPPPPVLGGPGMEPEPEIPAAPEPPVPSEPAPAEPEIAEPPPVADAEEPAPAEPTDAVPSELVLTFLEDSWVEIYDDQEQRLLVGLMREGTERSLSGVAPFRVFLGNAPGVRLEIDGEGYDPSGRARADSTARFVLERP
ncbi:hypothetical protein B1C78_16885 [Thioalkalivibrio denitrificans]|uniref:HTH cro/C1-type domain-containing protein n=1 Tax=Thioalkalivibrio denitrificans TaxID=108003 RepID=A0A1V3N6T3_9GAMM|nr:RodZ domain-containing protein [Thioalkalivibrio denitrificans]OOG20790.1 hypothetical protein B1C78_16885 [Thioalkalivibrio denitrificans]